ncbi:Serine/threonine-protein kinase AKL1 [Nakaseomyces bracarensis]|uniref:Serine/threonine-protein kinase AKL1 n=1 Tax=Nakaseomyces bracarensis TaxID=273131 RepID=A0ABR4NYF8_9SACH
MSDQSESPSIQDHKDELKEDMSESTTIASPVQEQVPISSPPPPRHTPPVGIPVPLAGTNSQKPVHQIPQVLQQSQMQMPPLTQQIPQTSLKQPAQQPPVQQPPVQQPPVQLPPVQQPPVQQSIPQQFPPVQQQQQHQPRIEEKFQPGKIVTVGSHKVEVVSYLAEGGFAQIYVVKFIEYTNEFERKNDETIMGALTPGSAACLKRVLVQDENGLNKMRSEVDVMKKLQGAPNIVQYFDSNASRLRDFAGNVTQGFEVLLLMELCPNKSLLDYMNQRLAVKLSEKEILKIMFDVTLAVAQMHYLPTPLIHRDIKIENVLVDAKNNFKLCDFGSTSTCFPAFTSYQDISALSQDLYMHTTPQYRAPEMIDLFKYIPINEKSDIWALGVFLYKLLFFTTPFERTGQFAMLHSKFEFPPNKYSSKLINLIIIMLAENPYLRPNIYQVLYYLNEIINGDVPLTVLKDKYGQGSYNFEKYAQFQKESQQIQIQLGALQAKISDPASALQPSDWDLYDRLYMTAFKIVPQIPFLNRPNTFQQQYATQQPLQHIAPVPVQGQFLQNQQIQHSHIPPFQYGSPIESETDKLRMGRSQSNPMGPVLNKENTTPQYSNSQNLVDGNSQTGRNQPMSRGNGSDLGRSVNQNSNVKPTSLGSVSPNYMINNANLDKLQDSAVFGFNADTNIVDQQHQSNRTHKMNNPFEHGNISNSTADINKNYDFNSRATQSGIHIKNENNQVPVLPQPQYGALLDYHNSIETPNPVELSNEIINQNSMNANMGRTSLPRDLPPRPNRNSTQSNLTNKEGEMGPPVPPHPNRKNANSQQLANESSQFSSDAGRTHDLNKVQDTSAQNILEEEGFFDKNDNKELKKEILRRNGSQKSSVSDSSRAHEKDRKLNIDFQEVNFSPDLENKKEYFEGTPVSDQLSYDLKDALSLDKKS